MCKIGLHPNANGVSNKVMNFGHSKTVPIDTETFNSSHNYTIVPGVTQ